MAMSTETLTLAPSIFIESYETLVHILTALPAQKHATLVPCIYTDSFQIQTLAQSLTALPRTRMLGTRAPQLSTWMTPPPLGITEKQTIPRQTQLGTGARSGREAA